MIGRMTPADSSTKLAKPHAIRSGRDDAQVFDDLLPPRELFVFADAKAWKLLGQELGVQALAW